jgi:hypothetical protein
LSALKGKEQVASLLNQLFDNVAEWRPLTLLKQL